MAGFIKKQETVANTPYKQFKFEKVGDSVTLLFMGLDDATSPEYGAFTVVKGLRFNPDAETIDEALKTAELVSFPNQTQIANKIDNGAMVMREAYTITSKWRKGDKYDGNKVCKSNGYDVTHLILEDEALQQLIKRYFQLLGKESSIVQAAEPVENEPTGAAPKEPRL